MSTNDQYFGIPPPPSNGGRSATIVIVVLMVIVVKVVFIVILCRCIKKTKESIVIDLHARTTNAAIVTRPPPNFNVAQIWTVDAETMEKFLLDMKKEKPARLTAQQLCSFTNNYSTILGSGGFGVVYKGEFPNGIKFAVKVLNRNSDKRVEEQFMAEVGTIGRTYHINLVRLYGFCLDQHMSALVYEYMENGSPDKFLFGKNPRIKSEKLHEIAIGTAKGLAYLHEECQQRIIHYDIKPGNVLLDTDFSPKVGDFGLAKLCNRDNTHDSVTGYRGTPGYAAPEFLLKNYPVSHKCDVYSFGMLLFEIVGRRKNVNADQTSGLDWFPRQVWEAYEKDGLMEMIVESGIEEKVREKAKSMFMVALWCAQDSPEARPQMSSVVKMLEGGVEILPPPKPFQYLYSVREGIPMTQNGSGMSGSYSTTQRTDSSWYKDSTPIMRKYEIQIASSS